jgi:hypothetical protein
MHGMKLLVGFTSLFVAINCFASDDPQVPGVLMLQDAPAQVVYDQLNLSIQTIDNFTVKAYTGPIDVVCSHTLAPAEGWGCAARIPGDSTNPTPKLLMMIDGETAKAFYSALGVPETPHNLGSSKEFTDPNATFGCEREIPQYNPNDPAPRPVYPFVECSLVASKKPAG